MGTVTDQAQTDWLRYFSLSNAGYEPDGNKKTNQDAFISYGDFGLCQPPPCNLEPSQRKFSSVPAVPRPTQAGHSDLMSGRLSSVHESTFALAFSSPRNVEGSEESVFCSV